MSIRFIESLSQAPLQPDDMTHLHLLHNRVVVDRAKETKKKEYWKINRKINKSIRKLNKNPEKISSKLGGFCQWDLEIFNQNTTQIFEKIKANRETSQHYIEGRGSLIDGKLKKGWRVFHPGDLYIFFASIRVQKLKDLVEITVNKEQLAPNYLMHHKRGNFFSNHCRRVSTDIPDDFFKDSVVECKKIDDRLWKALKEQTESEGVSYKCFVVVASTKNKPQLFIIKGDDHWICRDFSREGPFKAVRVDKQHARSIKFFDRESLIKKLRLPKLETHHSDLSIQSMSEYLLSGRHRVKLKKLHPSITKELSTNGNAFVVECEKVDSSLWKQLEKIAEDSHTYFVVLSSKESKPLLFIVKRQEDTTQCWLCKDCDNEVEKEHLIAQKLNSKKRVVKDAKQSPVSKLIV